MTLELVEGQALDGLVRSFDEHVGLGELLIFENGVSTGLVVPFHCVNIANSSRSIDENLHVSFKIFWHPRGRFEALEVRPYISVNLDTSQII